MHIIKHKHIFFGLTALLIIASIGAVIAFGLHLSIDFTGGTLAEIRYQGVRPDAAAIHQKLDTAGFKEYSVRELGSDSYVLRAQTITDQERGNLAQTFSINGSTAEVVQLSEVGPTIGAELRNKSLVAISLVVLCIILFIAFAFRKVSKPISSWIYGLIALVTLLHDVIVPVGFFALLGYLIGAQIDALFVTAILTVLGFSIHDTIVVFDRVRENLRINQEKGRREDFEETAGRALGQTFGRSINTSLTVIITLLVLYFVGPESTRIFSLTLLVGIIIGTYSSVFLATPLLVAVEKWRRQKGK